MLSMLMERDCSVRTISISQGEFIDSILTRFNLTDAAPVTTACAWYSSLLGRPPYVEGREGDEVIWGTGRSSCVVRVQYPTRHPFAASSLALARFSHNLADRCLHGH